jgi:hypothetical protein
MLIAAFAGLPGWGQAQDIEGALQTDAIGDERGNGVPDYSHTGYRGGNAAIPEAPVRVVVSPAEGDAGARIQAAIDYVGGLEPDAHGLRGAVLLERGRFEVEGQLRLDRSGVVLRGSGPGEDGTILTATGPGRRALIVIAGVNDRSQSRPTRIEGYVPVGATTMTLSNTEGLAPGTTVLVSRGGGRRGPDDEGRGRRGGAGFGSGAAWDRTVAGVDGATATLDAPLTLAIDPTAGGGELQSYDWPGRTAQNGVENLRLVSAYDERYPKDEDHAWEGVRLESVRDAWVRRVTFHHFAGSAVAVWESASRITVEDCRSLEPVSEIGGWRRRTFFTAGQQCLFLRCYSEQGREDFTVRNGAPGPNAFVHCDAREALGDSGAMDGGISGVLFDNVNIDGGGLRVGSAGSGRFGGATPSNCMLWQCTGSEIDCYRPREGQNWAYGCWATFGGDGVWDQRNEFVDPRSLMQGLMARRGGKTQGERIGPGVDHPSGSTNPTYEQAVQMAAASNGPAPQLTAVIEKRIEANLLPIGGDGAPSIEALLRERPELMPSPLEAASHPLKVENGRLTVDGRLLVGGRTGVDFWRGSTRRGGGGGRARMGITRYVPGMEGHGLTDNLDEATDRMLAEGLVGIDHHHGLWYDRRRDDHQRVRRMDAEVQAPFYEMPFARSGEGTAWDGLSRYDLTRYNRWYFDRLDRFAALCEQKGLLLIAQHYFQHNILEAGAHWAEFPWRSANNVNDTGFPEPPPYAGDKRIFQAHLFYDVDHPVRRRLHEAYIRHHLDELGDRANVIHMTSGEYSGPLRFTQFWLDTIAAWQQETGRDVIVGLSCPKDVQDAILGDPARAALVDVIDIRYWWYQEDGQTYAPEGGRNLAPRQHARQLRPKSTSAEAVYRAVREYRQRYPRKAVIFSADGNGAGEGPADGWAVVMAGGSLPASLPGADHALLTALARMTPADQSAEKGAVWRLAGEAGDQLVYARHGAKFTLDLSGAKGKFQTRWLTPGGEAVGEAQSIEGGSAVAFQSPVNDAILLWVTK